MNKKFLISMLIKIKRIDKSLPLPNYQTKGAVAFDIYSRIDLKIASRTLAKIPTNLIIEIPSGYLLAVLPRSSTPAKKGLSIPHGLGIIDQDYCGEEDEILYQVYNFTDQEVEIKKGERIGQACFIRADQFAWQEVEKMEAKNRSGFGSTGS